MKRLFTLVLLGSLSANVFANSFGEEVNKCWKQGSLIKQIVQYQNQGWSADQIISLNAGNLYDFYDSADTENFKLLTNVIFKRIPKGSDPEEIKDVNVQGCIDLAKKMYNQ